MSLAYWLREGPAEPVEEGRIQHGPGKGLPKLVFEGLDGSQNMIKKIATIDPLRKKIILIQPGDKSLYLSGFREAGIPGMAAGPWAGQRAETDGNVTMALGTQRKVRRIRFLYIFLVLAAAYTIWWWVDSARCEKQDEYSLHGICLMQLRDRAESGEVMAQWGYGDYLQGEGREQEGLGWLLRAMHGARTGLDLRDHMIGYCDRVPGFEARTVEAIMQRVAADSPDAHLRLLQLHTYPRCGAFDLDKAAAQIPLLTQCAHLSLAHYLRAARDARHRVAPATRQAIRSNMALCAQEVAHPPPIADTVREFMPVRQADLDALSRELDALDR